MKPLAIALAIATLVAPGLAGAQGYGGHGHDGGGREHDGGGRGGERGAYRGGGRGGYQGGERGGGWEQHGRFDGRGGPGFDPGGGPGYGPRGPGYAGPGPGYGDYGRSGYGPGPVRTPYGGGWRRGQYLPPNDQGNAINDYGRYHLRRPPRGYYWSRVGNDFVLAAVGTGLIFEVIGAEGY